VLSGTLPGALREGSGGTLLLFSVACEGRESIYPLSNTLFGTERIFSRKLTEQPRDFSRLAVSREAFQAIFQTLGRLDRWPFSINLRENMGSAPFCVCMEVPNRLSDRNDTHMPHLLTLLGVPAALVAMVNARARAAERPRARPRPRSPTLPRPQLAPAPLVRPPPAGSSAATVGSPHAGRHPTLRVRVPAGV
jgi:hypothetical protein